MKERPILFSAPMVRAILDGRKTQTRRIAWPFDIHHKDRKKFPDAPVIWAGAVLPARESGWVSWYPGNGNGRINGSTLADFTRKQYATGFVCPYGQPGDRLWVREMWRSFDAGTHEHPVYFADFVNPQGRWKSPIHMPRGMSRITLEVTGVRVERLQAITDEGAIAEGVTPSIVGQDLDHLAHRAGFQSLWDKINGDRASWESNPWVWVIEFRRMEAA